MNRIFDKVRTNPPKRSAFDLSHEKKLSCKFSQLVPILVEDVLPGDKFSGKSELMLRFAPMIAPVMHRIDVYVHYFFVPDRIIWDQSEDFHTGGDTGTSEPMMPKQILNTVEQLGTGTLSDYLGLPNLEIDVTSEQGFTVNELPYRAYHEIWNEYYRDENLQEKIAIDPLDLTKAWKLNTRAWEKDYFTSALPYPQ